MVRVKASASVKFLFILSLLAASVLPGLAEWEESATLSADSMNYDPRSLTITATGNVHLAAPDGELFADNGVGYTNGRTFEMHGSVKGHFDPESLDISCDSLLMESEGKAPVRRKLIATGSVNLSHREGRTAAQKLTC